MTTIREALEEARHALVTTHGLYAIDKNPGEEYSEAARAGCDPWACFCIVRDQVFQLDNLAAIRKIDVALEEPES